MSKRIEKSTPKASTRKAEAAKAKRNAEKAAKIAAAKKQLDPAAKKLLTGNTKKSKVVRAQVLTLNKKLGEVKKAETKKARKAALVSVADLKAKLRRVFSFGPDNWRGVRELAKANA